MKLEAGGRWPHGEARGERERDLRTCASFSSLIGMPMVLVMIACMVNLMRRAKYYVEMSGRGVGVGVVVEVSSALSFDVRNSHIALKFHKCAQASQCL
jgi:hypothetical protein